MATIGLPLRRTLVQQTRTEQYAMQPANAQNIGYAKAGKRKGPYDKSEVQNLEMNALARFSAVRWCLKNRLHK